MAQPQLRIGFYMATLLLALLTTSAMASEQTAKAGVYDASGQIKLLVKRFQPRFPDGTPVAELDVRISNGLAHVVRKGYGEDDACRTELIELTDADGFPVVAAAPQAAGTPVFISSLTPTKLTACLDDKCHALKHVVLPGEPPLLRAACDQTELSDNKCRCHVNDGSGDELTNGDFCDSWIEASIKRLSHWLRLTAIARS